MWYQGKIRALHTLVLALVTANGSFAQQPHKPDLHVLAIGCSEFTKCSPLSGANDAEEIVASFRRQEGSLFGTVRALLLTNRQVTRPNVLAALSNLRKQVRAGDYVIVTVSSHGGVDVLGRFFMTPWDYDPRRHDETAVFGSDLRKALNELDCIRLLFLDTCFAGSAVVAVQPGPANVPSLWQEGETWQSNFITIASCQSYQLSREEGLQAPVARRHGLASRAFLEAISGQADANRDGIVTLEEMVQYMEQRIAALARRQQTLSLYRPQSVSQNLPIGSVAQSGPMATFDSAAITGPIQN